MITRKELEYVGGWATRVPYPGYEYSKESLENLKKSILKYQEIYNGIKYNIVLSNSEELTLEIMSKNLAHMLGIEYKDLMNEYRIPFRKEALGLSEDITNVGSYNLIGLIIENMDKVLDYEDRTGNRNLNFYKISVKCEIFSKLLQLMNFNFGCINFNPKIYETNNGKPFSGNSSKFLFTQSHEAIAPYFMVGILKDNSIHTDMQQEEDIYLVETLIAPINVKNFFENQEVVIPTQILYDKNNILNKKSALPEQKRQLVSMYLDIVSKYGLDNHLNIFGDYMDLVAKEESFQKKL